MVSCLEVYSMEERHRELVKNRNNPNNPYSALHPDALATGDRNGKGTGHGGPSHWLPNCRGERNVINYSNFDTNPNPDNGIVAGCDLDQEARNTMMARSLYTFQNEYSAQLVDTSASIAEGQYKTY